MQEWYQKRWRNYVSPVQNVTYTCNVLSINCESAYNVPVL